MTHHGRIVLGVAVALGLLCYGGVAGAQTLTVHDRETVTLYPTSDGSPLVYEWIIVESGGNLIIDAGAKMRLTSTATSSWNLWVKYGGTATIKPNVKMEFVPSATGSGYILVTGELRALGEAGLPILFTSSNPTRGSWQGVVIGREWSNRDSKYYYGTGVLDHTVTTHATTGINNYGSLTVTDSEVAECSGDGIWLHGMQNTVTGTRISGCGGRGVFCEAGSTLIDVTAENCVGYAVSSGYPLTMTHCSCRASTGGVWLSPRESPYRDALYGNVFETPVTFVCPSSPSYDSALEVTGNDFRIPGASLNWPLTVQFSDRRLTLTGSSNTFGQSGVHKSGIKLSGSFGNQNTGIQVTLPSPASLGATAYVGLPHIYQLNSLTLSPGTVVKFDGPTAAATVWGGLGVGNTTDRTRSYLTSLKDDAAGGDTDGVAAVPAKGDWSGLIVGYDSGLTRYYGGVGLNSTTVRYGGFTGPGGAGALVHIDVGSVSATDSELSQSTGTGVIGAGIPSGSIDLTHCTIRDCATGISGSFQPLTLSSSNFMENVTAVNYSNGTVRLEGCWFTGRDGVDSTGLFRSNASSSDSVKNNTFGPNLRYGIVYSSGTTVLDATNNWWRDPLGPRPYSSDPTIAEILPLDKITVHPCLQSGPSLGGPTVTLGLQPTFEVRLPLSPQITTDVGVGIKEVRFYSDGNELCRPVVQEPYASVWEPRVHLDLGYVDAANFIYEPATFGTRSVRVVAIDIADRSGEATASSVQNPVFELPLPTNPPLGDSCYYDLYHDRGVCRYCRSEWTGVTIPPQCTKCGAQTAWQCVYCDRTKAGVSRPDPCPCGAPVETESWRVIPWDVWRDWRAANHTYDNHTGTDWGCALLTEVRASRAGDVAYVEDAYDDWGPKTDGRGLGNHVIIQHGPLDDGSVYFTVYAHLERNTITVAKGQPVAAGQPIAQAGASGNTYGVHLHLGVWRAANPLAPTWDNPGNTRECPYDLGLAAPPSLYPGPNP